MTVKEKVTILKSEKEVKIPNESDYKTFLNDLKEGKKVNKSLFCLFETIKTNSKTLSVKDKERIINALVALMKKETVDLKKFLEEDVFSCFNIEKYKKQFLGLIRTVEPSNKNNLHRILGKLVDVSQDKNEIIKKILFEISKDNSYNDVFLYTKKSHDEVISQELEKLNDKDYVNIFCELKSLNKHSPRKITKFSNDKYKYVKKAIDFGFINEIIPFYYNDKDVKIRQLLSSTKFANNNSIISRFLNDHNSLVRCNMIDNLDVEDVIKMNFDVFDRVLDVDDSVRQKSFAFFEKFINYVKNHHCISYFKNTQDSNLSDEKIKRTKTNIDEEEVLDIVSDALINLFKGLNTIRQDEYSKLIDKLDLSIDFYVDFEKEIGVEVYLENNRENVFKNYNYKDLNEDQRKIYFLYSNETLKDNEVKDLIKNDLMSAMVYLRDKDITNYIFEIYDEINEKDLHLKILILMRLGKYKDLLNDKMGRQPKDLVAASFLNGKIDLDTSKNTFESIFYQAKHGQLNFDHLNKCDLSNHELLEIIIVSKSLDLLSTLTDRLLEDAEKFKDIFNERLEMNKKVMGSTLNDFILEGKHNLYLYVLLFGNIKSGCVDFFISFLHFLASSTRNKEKISKFYKKYLGNVSKNVFNEFASVCYNLKTKSMYPTNEQEYNVIHEKDEMLYYIVYIVLNYNVYEVNDKKYDLEKFYDVIEENLPLVLSKINLKK